MREDRRATFVFYAGLILFALLAPIVTGSSGSASLVLTFAIAAGACNLLLGYAGLLSFAQGSFFGVGSYVAGLCLKAYPALGVGVMIPCLAAGVLLALVIGGLSIRQRGIYFVMITLAMAQLVFFAALSMPGWTGGENGLLDIPSVRIGLPDTITEALRHYVLVAVLFVAALAFMRRVVRSSYGRVLDAARENEDRATTIGFDVRKLKLLAFCISGAITSMAGALYAIQLHSAPISNVDLTMSESILIMAILGGRRSLMGAAFGALAMTLLAEQLSPLWPRWQMIVGAVLIAVVIFAPDGLGGVWRKLVAAIRVGGAPVGTVGDAE